MRLYFCTTDRILSRLIRWCLGEPASHFAIEFDKRWVIHSALLGSEIDWVSWFKSNHQIISILSPIQEMTLEQEEAVYQKALGKEDARPVYDYPAFLYFCWRGLLFKLFKKPLPVKNPFNTPQSFLCTEEAQEFGLIPQGPDLSIISPWTLRKMLLDTGKYIEVNQ